jgi:hypothetical protein
MITLNINGVSEIKVTETVPKGDVGKEISDYDNAFNYYTKPVVAGKIDVTLNKKPLYVEISALADTAPPVISAISSSAITTDSATISWTTDEKADSQVVYGPDTSYGTEMAMDANLVTAHTQNITGLTPATAYHYRVKSKDATGNLAISGDSTFTTLPKIVEPIVCENFTYSSWSTCASNIKTRKIAASSPQGCTGGNPVLQQECVKPKITGVVNNKAYNTDVTPVISGGTATLNSQPFASGATISAEGKYALIATNTAGSTTVSFIIDKTPPVGTISINNNALSTTSSGVILKLNATDNLSGVTQMRFANDGKSWSVFMEYRTSYPWSLIIPLYGGNPAEGTKTIYAKFKDKAGNVSQVAQDDIVYGK